MAQEKRTNLNFSVVKDGQTSQIAIALAENLAGTLSGCLTQSIGTGAWVALNLGTVTAPDLLCVRNTDATNYVQIASDAAGTKIVSRVKPRRASLIDVDPGTTTFYAKANGAACVVQILAAEA